ncbi:uncharacterized protein [Centruroides vittatus]|uniref:uncharacterized protein n=1 Tax=Centruroides vittatus TaxID=120091 RepID=UPI00350EC822
MNKELKLKFIFHSKKIINKKENKHLTYLTSFLNNFVEDEPNHSLTIGHLKEISTTKCGDVQYEIECIITNLNLNVFTSYMEIIKRWCLQFPSDNCSDDLSYLLKFSEKYFETQYQNHEDIQIESISFGTFIKVRCFMQHFEIKKRGEIEISCSFWHDQRSLELFLYYPHDDNCCSKTSQLYRFTINYNDIMRIIIENHSNESFISIYFYLHYPPKIFISIQKQLNRTIVANTRLKDKVCNTKFWERVTDIGCICNKSYLRIKGQNLSKCPVVKICIPDKFRSRFVINRLYQRYSLENIYYTTVHKHEWQFFKIHCPFSTFRCHYAWRALNGRSFEMTDQIIYHYSQWNDLFKQLKIYEEHNSEALEKAMFEFYNCLEKGVVLFFPRVIKILFQYFCNIDDEDDDKIDGLCLVRRVFITPSRILYLPLQQHFENRVLRHYDPEFSLRISIRDDNLNKLTFGLTKNNAHQFLKGTVGKYLLNGIKIAGRHYTFLGASPSQLRDHGIWMYASDNDGNTSESIIKWLGDFSEINNVAKLMARIGQCFSNSEEAIYLKINELNIQNTPDITCKRENKNFPPYIFTDGVGISSDFVNKVRFILC